MIETVIKEMVGIIRFCVREQKLHRKMLRIMTWRDYFNCVERMESVLRLLPNYMKAELIDRLIYVVDEMEEHNGSAIY